ncbi:MAG TPA: DUF2207 domain-containing protein, partial [Solirubrobacterales bacterium]
MKRGLLVLGVAVAAILAIPGAALARSLTVTDAGVGLRLAKDASLIVRETLTTRFDGTYNAMYRDIPLAQGESINTGQVSVSEGGRAYSPGGCTTFGCIDVAGRFGVTQTPDGSGARIVWHPVASDEQRTFTVTYRVVAPRHVIAYGDVIDVYWRVWGDQWDFSLDHLTADLRDPALRAHPGQEASPSNPSAVWGHPREVEGRDFLENGVAGLEASDIPARQFVELRALVPRTAGQGVAAAGRGEGSGLEKVSEEEQGVDDDFNSPWNKTKRFVAHHAELLAGIVTALLLLALALMLWLAREHRTSAPEYVPEPPDDASPALAYGLAHEGDDSEDTVLATLLDLIERDYYETKQATTEDEKLDLAITKAGKRPKAELEPYEQDVLDFFDELIADETVPLSEMKDRIPEHSASWRARWESMTGSLNAADEGQLEWDRNLNPLSLLVAFVGGVLVAVICLIQNNVEGKWFIAAATGAIGVAIVALWPSRRLTRLAPQDRERSAQWESFQRWTDDFPRLKDDPPATLELWKRILIYG